MITFDEVIPWFYKFETSRVRPDINQLISRMRACLDTKEVNEVAEVQKQLLELSRQLRDEKEVTEILVECAIASSLTGKLDKAETLLMDAVASAWSSLHKRAVIQTMVGCVQWGATETKSKAIISWRNALFDFEWLKRQPGLPNGQSSWFRETCTLLEKNLLDAMEIVTSEMKNTPLPVEKAQADEGEPADPAGQGTPTGADGAQQGPSAAPSRSDILQWFTISEEIPAGDFGPSGVDPFPIGVVEVEQVSINGHPFSIHATRGKRIIHLPSTPEIQVVKVKGDSMNEENILKGDYVILRRADSPNNGDIVMAEIVGIDTSATLKRFYKDQDTIILQPRSSNPLHKPYVFKKVGEGFYIRGVVIAVLKPA